MPTSVTRHLHTYLLGELALLGEVACAIELQAVATHVAEFASCAHGEGTRRVYRSAWRGFETWCHSLGRDLLECPEMLLHTNGTEDDICCHVTNCAVSRGPRSDAEHDRREAFLRVAKKCCNLGVAFWDYLGAGIGGAGAPPVPLSNLIRCRGQPA